MMDKARVMARIQNREIAVGVVGLGYVGLPLAVEKAKAGFPTVGFDLQAEKVEKVNRGENYIGDVVDGDLREMVSCGKLRATKDFSVLGELDFIAVCVPTPLDRYKQPNLSYVKTSCEEIGKYLKAGSMVVLESTTYPGTTEELIRPILEHASGLQCGEDFYLGFSPERVDPGNRFYNTKNTPKVVGGIGADATEAIACMYRTVLDGEIVTVSSPKVAEMEKILENTYRNINIGLANEMAMICHMMDINVWEVIDAAKSKPYGFQAFYPGAGVGGHCIPIDPYYLTWKAREYDYHTRLIETSGEINSAMPRYIVQRCSEELGRRGKPLCGAKVLLLGAAYKNDIDDCRESPALRLLDCFLKQGSRVDYFDPYVTAFWREEKRYESLAKLDPQTVARYDLVLVATAHRRVDYQMVAQNAALIFDCKNALAGISRRDNIVLL